MNPDDYDGYLRLDANETCDGAFKAVPLVGVLTAIAVSIVMKTVATALRRRR